MTRCDTDSRIRLRFFRIRHTAVDQHRATVLRHHARSVGSRTTCTVRAETTQDGTIHAWMVCTCLVGSIQTAVVEMCLIGTRGCALSLSTCRVRCRDTQRASSPRPYHNQRVGIPHVPQVTRLCDTGRNLSGTTLPCNRPQWQRD